MNIKILGAGCKKCLALENNAKSAVEAAGLTADFEKITDVVAIAGFGVMATPALVINDQVVAAGKVLSIEEIGELIVN